MMSSLLSRCLILVLGTLYPAYRSYKAIKNKDLREHVKWMMYWIVFALFTTLETFLDIFVSWFPFYYEIKILFILWVLSPATRGSSILYKKVVHPMLISRENEIDELIEKTKVQGYSTFIQLFTSGFNYASTLFMNSAMRGQTLLGSQIKKSLSFDDVYESNDQKIRSSKSNDGYFLLQKESVNNAAESSDFDDEPEIIRKQITKVNRKNNSSGIKNVNTRVYDLIDDEDILIDEAIETQKIKNKNTTKRKVKQNTDQASNHRTNEASHYGTITRGKVSKNRVVSNTNDTNQ